MYWTNALIDVLLFFFVIDCLLMCLVVLMQRSKQEGLGAAFGGGFTESVWGAQTSQVLVKSTVWLAAIFFIISILLARLYSYRESLAMKGSPVQQELLHAAAPVSSAAPAVAPAATSPAPVTSAVVPTATPMRTTPAAAPPNAAPVPVPPATK